MKVRLEMIHDFRDAQLKPIKERIRLCDGPMSEVAPDVKRADRCLVFLSLPPDVPGFDGLGLPAGSARHAPHPHVHALRPAAQRLLGRQEVPRQSGRSPGHHHG